MPTTISGVKVYEPEELESLIARTGVPREKAQAARLENQRLRFVAQRRQQRDAGIGGTASASVVRGVLGTVMNFANTASLGLASAVPAAITAPVTQFQRNRAIEAAGGQPIGLGEAFELNRARASTILGTSPVGQTAGQVAGVLGPGPAGAVVRTGAKALSRGAARATGAARRGEDFATVAATRARKAARDSGVARRARAAERIAVAKGRTGERAARLARDATSLARRRKAQSFVAQIAEGYTSAVGAVGALSLAETPFTEKTAGQTAQELIEAPFSLATLVGGFGVGATQGAFRVARANTDRIQDATLALLDRARARLPGLRVSPDIPRDENGLVHGLIDTLAKSTGGRRLATTFMREGFFEPMRAAVDQVRRRFGIGGVRSDRLAEVQAKAASAVRQQVGTTARVDPATGKRIESAIAQERAAITQRGFAAGGGREMTPEVGRSLQRGMASLEARRAAARGTMGERGTELKEVLANTRNVLSNPQGITVQHLENLRKRLAPIAKFGEQQLARNGVTPQMNRADIGEAKRLYRHIRAAERRLSPEVDAALKDAAELHTMARRLGNLVKQGDFDDVKLLESVFSSREFNSAWPVFVSRMTESQLGALRGAYLGQFLERTFLIGNRREGFGVFSDKNMQRLWGGTGKFRREVFETVLPDVATELSDLGEISALYAKSGIGGAEGSQTFRRLQDFEVMEEAAQAGVELVGAVAGIVKDPSLGFILSKLLKAPGMALLARSAFQGKIAEGLNALATGGPVSGPARAVAAFSEAPETGIERTIRENRSPRPNPAARNRALAQRP